MGFVQWNSDNLEKAVRSIWNYSVKYDASLFAAGIQEPADLAKWLMSLAPVTFALGDGGIVFLNPLIPHVQASCHIFIWDRQYMRRIDLLRATARFIIRNWKLQRLTGATPARHRMAIKNAERVGFAREGRLRNAIRYNEGVDDLVVMGLLAEEI